MFFTHTHRFGRSVLAAASMVSLMVAPARAQQRDPPPPRIVTLTGGVDLLNTHVFRGIRQNATEVAMQPFVDVGVTLHEGDGVLSRLGVQAGVWNGLHTGDTGSAGPGQSMRYESDYYATIATGFAERVTLATSITVYTSPNQTFTTVKELSIKAVVDGQARLRALSPYALLAVELDTARGIGQADGGANAGRYFEAGVTPSVGVAGIALSLPVRVGMSVGGYYELAGEDHAFGFLSTGAMVTVPLVGTRDSRGLSVRGGVESHVLGETTRAFNEGSRSKTTATFGLRVSY